MVKANPIKCDQCKRSFPEEEFANLEEENLCIWCFSKTDPDEALRPPRTALMRIYNFFKPLPEATVWSSIKKDEDGGQLVEVCVSWASSNGYMRWFNKSGQILFEFMKTERRRRQDDVERRLRACK